jgi:Beta-galactosidase/Glycosyl hydrolase catalytic core
VRVNPWHLEHDLRVIRRLGVRWLRTEFDWRKLEPVRGRMKFEWFDTLVKLCESMRIRLVPVVTYTPRWMAPRFNVPPEPEPFADLIEALVRRYGHYVKHWEIWNEANSYFFWMGDAAQYAGLLGSASAAAKRADGESKILMCGLADPARPDMDFLFDVLKRTDGRSVDILNLHAYPGTWNSRAVEDWPSLLTGLRERLVEIGVDKPLWVTETGLSSQEGSFLEDKRQESYLVRAFASLLGSGALERVFWYRLKDEASAGNGPEDDRFGLLTQDTIFGGRKRVYRGYSRLSRTLPSGLGSLAGGVFRDRPKGAFKAYSALIGLLGQDPDCTSSTFDGSGACSVSLQLPAGPVRIFWDGRAGEIPQASVSGSEPFTLGAVQRGAARVPRGSGGRTSSKARNREVK